MLTGKLGQHADSHSSSCEDSFPSWLSCQKHNILNRLQCGQFLGLMESDSDSQFSVILEGGGNISGTEVVVEEGDEVVVEEGGEVVVEEGDEVVLEDAEIGIREAFTAGAVSTLDFSKVFEDGGTSCLHGFSGFSAQCVHCTVGFPCSKKSPVVATGECSYYRGITIVNGE